jgi:hypothetical protein
MTLLHEHRRTTRPWWFIMETRIRPAHAAEDVVCASGHPIQLSNSLRAAGLPASRHACEIARVV